MQWARKTGPATAELITQILASRRHPQQGFRSCLGIIRLGKTHGAERLQAAGARALHIRAFSYKPIASIVQHKLDQQPLPAPARPVPVPEHGQLGRTAAGRGDVTFYDGGRSIAPWVSAFEILTHPGKGKVTFRAVYHLFEKGDWRHKALRVQRYKAHATTEQ